ncbi:hypothetical protein PENTCL1PPCAC_22349 [Pristionchus entomophagus]|uniref:Uncharacterized protein n=1 Tax=Pristionchus entomophagus TaxID=358040 RepID=A0AAV5U169_9BILA|nr:hypothetical protein PENTCL1PPCAC_22349 [Pristionchus entomophagus]
MRLLIGLAVLWIAVQCQNRPSNPYYDKLYDDYLNRMRQYAEEVRIKKEAAMAKQAMATLASISKNHGWMEDTKWKSTNGGDKTDTPVDPFGKLPLDKDQSVKSSATTDEVCRKFAPSVHLHCRGSSKDKHAMRCFSYFRDCASVIPKDDPLSALAAIYSTLPKPEGSTDMTVSASLASEGFIPELRVSPPSLLSMSSTSSPPPLDPPRVMTSVEKSRVDMACRRVMPTATRYCHGKYTHSKLRSSCQTYLTNCAHLIPKSNPLHNLAQEALSLQIIPPAVPSSTAIDEWETKSQASSSDPLATAPLPSSVTATPSLPSPPSHPTAQSASTLTAEQIQEMERDARLAKADLPEESLVVLHKTCDRFLPTVRKHCVGDFSKTKYANRCKSFYQDCQGFMPQADPLYEIAHAFDSGVGLNLGSWAVAGIPYYPVNEEGAIGGAYMLNIPFGSWGGGYSQHIGVRDYWAQYQEVGANWYDGKYGYKSGWSVPLVQSLGIEGETHAAVSVPIKPGDLGKPIGVDVGGGVGPYYQQNQHVGVDWMDGQVNSNFGVGVPIAGVGVNTGVGVAFPGAGTWLG